jgi:hypothetical protein
MALGQTQATSISAIPGVETALLTIKAQVGKFFELPLRIRRALDRAAKLQLAANTKGLSAEAAALVGLSRALESLRSLYATTEGKLRSVLDDLKTYGLGFLPIALGLAALGVAATMAYLFKTVSFQESVLDKIEKKVLTPAEAEAVFGRKPAVELNLLGGAALPVLLVAGGGLWLLSRRGR